LNFRTSSTEATKAFAVATSGSQNSLDRNSLHRHSTDSAKLLSSKIHRIDRLNSAGILLETLSNNHQTAFHFYAYLKQARL
jgi:hypothetical protein